MTLLIAAKRKNVRRTAVGFWEAVGLVFGGGVAGTLGTKFFSWLLRNKKTDQEFSLASRTADRNYNNEIFDRLSEDIVGLKKEVKDLKKSESNCREELSKVWRQLEKQTVINQYLKRELAIANPDSEPFIEPTTGETQSLQGRHDEPDE